MKPKAKYVFSPKQRRNVIKWMRELRMPNGYSSNILQKIGEDNEKFIGLESHDCRLLLGNFLIIYGNP